MPETTITERLAEALRAILTAHAGTPAEVKAMADGLTVLDAYDNPPEEPAHA